ncbi:hypothetical protein LB505_008783 [Fusarium chuoi]|nr:hypothetical protein LB505_008783 [Fusarium chuoi]
MIAESVNNTFGRTVNPKNRNTTSGGSSGGESALIAFKGSPLGADHCVFLLLALVSSPSVLRQADSQCATVAPACPAKRPFSPSTAP